MSNPTKISQTRQILINRIAYGLFLLFGLFYLFIRHDMSNTVLFMGLGLIFDPFDPSIKWKERPAYQKVIPIVQVLIVLTAFVFMFIH